MPKSNRSGAQGKPDEPRERVSKSAKRRRRRAIPSAPLAGPPRYIPSDGERDAIERLAERMKSAPAPRYKVGKTDAGTATLAADHPEPRMTTVLLHNSLSTGSPAFASGLRDQMAQASRTTSALNASELNAMLAVVHGIGPRDETEALLAAQMAAVHNAVMMAARRLNHAENIALQDGASNMLTKLSRTFAGQVETLKRYRSVGEQTIKVQHVTINDGGQAIVGDVNTGGGTPNETRHQPLEPEAEGCAQVASRTPLLGKVEAFGSAMPGTGGARLDRVPLPRRPRRSAKG